MKVVIDEGSFEETLIAKYRETHSAFNVIYPLCNEPKTTLIKYPYLYYVINSIVSLLAN
jgi:hypothetical protein